jgi:hypothetical protein
MPLPAGAIYALLGDKEMAIQQLRLSFQQRESTFIAIKIIDSYVLLQYR